MKALRTLAEFLKKEEDQRRSGLFADNHPYIKEVVKAGKALDKLDKLLKDAKALKKAAEKVQAYDDLHGYGAGDKGYNLLSELYEAAYNLKL